MKGLFIIAIAFLASWTTATSPTVILPIQTSCLYPEPDNLTMHLAHETNCELFYKCSTGLRVEQKCPIMTKGTTARLHYNIHKQVCDWPWQAGCSDCPEPENGIYLPISRISNPNDPCNSYYECVNGNKVLQYCGSGTCFSHTCQRCVSNWVGGSCNGGGIIPSPTRFPIPDPDPICRTGNRIAHDCNCALYFECVNDQDWVSRECSGGLHFSPTALQCLPPDEANCVLPYSKK